MSINKLSIEYPGHTLKCSVWPGRVKLLTGACVVKNNLKIYNDFVGEYSSYMLVPAERELLGELKDHWSKMRMLDIGVGTGRTSYTFSAIVKDYTGIDYSQKMIEKCKDVIGEHDTVRFTLQDATDLSKYYDQKFDFVLFSMNGIDSVDHNDRKKILLEVHKNLDDDGFFFFSTHSLHTFPDSFPFRYRFSKFNKRKPIHSVYQWWKILLYKVRMWNMYRGVDVQGIQGKSWAILITGDHDFKMQIYHIKPDYQVKELEGAGFEVISVYDDNGNLKDPLKDRINRYMYFLCKKSVK